MNRGTPPTGPNARTGEFTPPGVTSSARANSSAERSSSRQLAFFLAGVNQELKQAQRVRQRPSRGLPDPAYVLARRRTWTAGRARNCPGSASAAPRSAADVSGEESRPQDHHSSSSAGAPLVATKKSIRSAPCTATGPVSHAGRGHRGQRGRAGDRGNVQNVKNPPGDEYHVRLRTGFPPLPDRPPVHRRLHLPGRRDRMRARRRAADPVARARPARLGHPVPSRPRLGCAPRHTGQPSAAYSRAAAPSAGGRCAARRRPRRRIIVTIGPALPRGPPPSPTAGYAKAPADRSGDCRNRTAAGPSSGR